MLSLEDLLKVLVSKGGSDLHISAGSPPRIRVDGELRDVDGEEVLTPKRTGELIYTVLTESQVAEFERELELDLSFGIKGLGRFRTNVFYQRGSISAALRLIPFEIMGFEELGLPASLCKRLCRLPKGLVLVTGATGSGKSSTLAAMADYINDTRNAHIVTIEDPIEFVHRNRKCLFNQREVGNDTKSFGKALRSVMRQDPDIIIVGEMRDQETISAALTLSETGHLTLGTLHTSDCIQTMNRIVDIFPAHQQDQIRTLLSLTLQSVFCQQLLPRPDSSGRVLAVEILISTPAIRALIREGKVHQIYSSLQTGAKLGMQTMNMALYDLCMRKLISYEEAVSHSLDPDDLRKMIEERRTVATPSRTMLSKGI